MTMTNTFRYLNRDNRWRGFHLHGLELGTDGALRLAALPAVEGEPPTGLSELGLPDGPAGIAVGPDGAVYFSDPAGHRLLRVDGCDGCASPVACVGGAGDAPGRLNFPRGVLYLPQRRALAVADSANHRVQLFNAVDFQLVDVWGRWGKQPGEFRSPVALAAGSDGSVYVVDNGVRFGDVDLLEGEDALVRPGIQRFDPLGQVVPGFAARVGEEAIGKGLPLYELAGVAVGRGQSGEDQVYVLDSQSAMVFVFDTNGGHLETLDLSAAPPSSVGPLRPMGLAVKGRMLYVGDNGGRRILCFYRDGRFVGAAVGYAGPVAALAGDGRGGLLVHSGQVPEVKSSRSGACGDPCESGSGGDTREVGYRAGLPLRLAAQGGFVRRGFMWGGPFDNPSFRMEHWHRIRARLSMPGVGGHAQLYVYSGSAKPGEPPPADPSAVTPPWGDESKVVDLLDCVAPHLGSKGENGAKGGSGSGGKRVDHLRWVRVPLDAPETMLPGHPDEALWIGVELSGEGISSPVLEQIRVDFDHQTLLGYLPAIFQADGRARNLLARFLTLYQSGFEDIETALERLPAQFDPMSAPTDALDWLAGWLALDLAEDWTESRKRHAIREAFDLYGWRGTPEGLRRATKLFTGADVRIEEPIRFAQWWSLASKDDSDRVMREASMLGVTTMLAPAEPQGAVLGTSAVLDGSHLITAEEYGAPLFTDVAHQFSVLMYQGQNYSKGTEAAVRAVIERERPAHTAYHLCVVEPKMRIGLQSRLGIDTIVAGPLLPTGLGDAAEGGIVIGGDPPGRIGETSTLGVNSRLGGAIA